MGRLIHRVQEVARGIVADETGTTRVTVVAYDASTNTYVVRYRGTTVADVPNLGVVVLSPGESGTLLLRGARPVGMQG